MKLQGKKVDYVEVEVSDNAILESVTKILHDRYGFTGSGDYRIDSNGNLILEYEERWGSHSSYEREVIRPATEDDRKFLTAIEVILRARFPKK